MMVALSITIITLLKLYNDLVTPVQKESISGKIKIEKDIDREARTLNTASSKAGVWKL